MEIHRSRLNLFLRINKELQSKINSIANILGLTESKSPGKSLRSRSHRHKNLRYEKDNLEVVNIGLFGHDIMRNQEYKLLEQNLSYFKEPILDIGCGDGQFATLLSKKIDAGVDLSPHSIVSASNLGIYSDLKVADCTKHIPYPDGMFNTIFSNSVLEHIPDVEGVVREASRTLRKDGHFLITTYSNKFLEELTLVVGDDIANSYNSGLTHVSLHNIEYWDKLLDKYGLTKVKILPYLSIDALLQMVIYSSRFYVIPQLLFPSLFWRLSKQKLHTIVSKSLDVDNGLGFLLIAKKK